MEGGRRASEAGAAGRNIDDAPGDSGSWTRIARCRMRVRQEELEPLPRTGRPRSGRAMPWRAFAPGRRPTRGRVDEGRTVAFGFAPPSNVSPPVSADSTARLSRMLEPSEWASAGIPLLRDPREVVTGLHHRHRPGPSTAIVAVLDPQERVAASASFTEPAVAPDGWQFRNALLAHLRRVIPHDLRLRAPVRTAVLLYCREGEPRWTEADGAWMWGLRDACTLHGLRCGAYITLTGDRWQVLGEGRGGRRPRSPSQVAAPHAESRRTTAAKAESPRAESPHAETSRRESPHATSPRTDSARAGSGTTDSPPTGSARTDSPHTGSPHTGSARTDTPRTSARLPVVPERAAIPSPTSPERAAPGRPSPSEPPRNGTRTTARRSGGGVAGAQRHTAAR